MLRKVFLILGIALLTVGLAGITRSALKDKRRSLFDLKIPSLKSILEGKSAEVPPKSIIDDLKLPSLNPKKGCCWLAGKTFEGPKDHCEFIKGLWTEGSCQPGFSTHLEGKNSSPITLQSALGQGSQGWLKEILEKVGTENFTLEIKVTIDATTCEETPYATWSGTAETEITTKNPLTGTQTSRSVNPISLPLSENGSSDLKGEAAALALSASGLLTRKEISLTLNYGALPPFEVEGTIIKGASVCLNK